MPVEPVIATEIVCAPDEVITPYQIAASVLVESVTPFARIHVVTPPPVTLMFAVKPICATHTTMMFPTALFVTDIVNVPPAREPL